MELLESARPLFNRLSLVGALAGSIATLAACGGSGPDGPKIYHNGETITVADGLSARMDDGHDIIFRHADMWRYIHRHNRTVLTVTINNRHGTQEIILANGQSIASSNAYIDKTGDLAIDCLPLPRQNTCDIDVTQTRVTSSQKPINTRKSRLYVRPAAEFLLPNGQNT